MAPDSILTPAGVAGPAAIVCARGRGREVESSLEEEVSCGVKS